MSQGWIDACAADAIEEEDIIRFDAAGRIFAIYRVDDDRYFTTGAAKGAPVCVDIETYPAKVEGDRVFIKID